MSGLFKGSVFILVSLLPIFLIGILSNDFGDPIIKFAVALIVIMPIFLLLMRLCKVLVELFTLSSDKLSSVSNKILRFHNRVDYYWSKHIETFTEKNKFLHIPFITCYIAKGFYFVTYYILNYLFVPAIIFSVYVAGYSINSYKVDFREPIAEFFIEKLSYFSTKSVFWNTISATILLIGILATLVVGTLTIKSHMLYVKLVRFKQLMNMRKGISDSPFPVSKLSMETCIDTYADTETDVDIEADSDDENYVVLSKQEYMDLMANANIQVKNQNKLDYGEEI